MVLVMNVYQNPEQEALGLSLKQKLDILESLLQSKESYRI